MQSVIRFVFLLCCFSAFLALPGCAKETAVSNPGVGPEALAGQDSRAPFSTWKPTEKDEKYLTVLKSALVEDRVYSWNTLASAVIVRALPYSARVAGAAEYMHGDRPFFYNEVGRWGRNAAFKPGAPVVVLMGLYAPGLREKDVTKLERFRLRLAAPDGRLLEPLEIKRYGRASVFIGDHFPVFNHWEEVYMVKFPSPGSNWQSGRLSFQLDWPGGSQHLSLDY